VVVVALAVLARDVRQRGDSVVVRRKELLSCLAWPAEETLGLPGSTNVAGQRVAASLAILWKVLPALQLTRDQAHRVALDVEGVFGAERNERLVKAAILEKACVRKALRHGGQQNLFFYTVLFVLIFVFFGSRGAKKHKMTSLTTHCLPEGRSARRPPSASPTHAQKPSQRKPAASHHQRDIFGDRSLGTATAAHGFPRLANKQDERFIVVLGLGLASSEQGPPSKNN
jgi:hypothetical protein